MNLTVISVETNQGLLIDASHCFISVGSLVSCMVVDGEGTLGAHELGHRRVVVVRDLLAVERLLDVGKVVSAGRHDFSARDRLRIEVNLDIVRFEWISFYLQRL